MNKPRNTPCPSLYWFRLFNAATPTDFDQYGDGHGDARGNGYGDGGSFGAFV